MNDTVYLVQCKTWRVARRLSGLPPKDDGTRGDWCRVDAILSPPWCLRLRPEFRTQAHRDYRTRVANEVRQLRAAGMEVM